MCLQGGEQIDISQLVPPTAVAVELKVTLASATGALVVYSPGYEAEQVRFTKRESFHVVQIAEPILCMKATGGPLELDVAVLPIEDEE